jgi:hypothetical protein
MTPTLTTIEGSSIDENRDVWDWLHAHGLPTDQLVDPGTLTLSDFEGDRDFRLVDWDDNGPAEFPVSIDDLIEDPHLDDASAAVVYGRLDTVQPIGFGRPLNSGRVVTADGTPTDDVTVFAFGERQYPDLTVADVVDALGRIRYRTPLRRETVEQWCEVFGVDVSITSWESDASGEWVRAEFVPQRIVAQIDGVETREPESGISGHKKRGRQRFNRNLAQLESEVLADV